MKMIAWPNYIIKILATIIYIIDCMDENDSLV